MFFKGARQVYSGHSVLALGVVITAWRLATMVANPLNLSFDEAQYWIWAQVPALGYFSKPPMIAWIIAITTGLCGESEPCVRLGAPLAYLVVSFALYDIGQRLYSSMVGFWSAAIFLTLPGVAFSAMLISVDALLLMFWTVALAVLIRAVAEDRLVLWIALGCVIGLGLLAKYTMLFFIISLLLYLVWSPTQRSLLRTARLWLAICLALICLSPNLLWNATHNFVTLKHVNANAHLAIDSLLHLDKGLLFISSQFAVFGPIPMAVLVWLIAWPRRVVSVISTDQHAYLLLSFTLPLLVVMTVESFLSRAHANWSAPIFVSATVLIVTWLVRLHKTWLLKAVFALHLAAAVVLYNLDQTAAVIGYSFTARSDPFKRVRGWEAIGRAVTHMRDNYPNVALLFDSRKVLASVVYYARPFAFDAVIWNESGIASNHFELTTDISLAINQSFLLLTEYQSAEHVAHAFARTELVAVLHVPLYTDFTRELRVFRCDNFHGYMR